MRFVRFPEGIVCLFSLFACAAAAQTTFNSGNGAIALQADGSSSCGDSTGTVCKATVYPSPIGVSGLTGSLSNITVTLNNVNITAFQSAIFILTSPGGATLVFDAGANCGGDTTGQTINFNDAGSTALQGTSFPNCNNLGSGSYKPDSIDIEGVTYPTLGTLPNSDYAPSDGSATFVTGTSAKFNGLTGTNLNGTWNLYVLDGQEEGTTGSFGSSSGPA